MDLSRRELLAGGLGTLAFGPGLWDRALAARERATVSAYGALRAADANGLRLPPGFRSRRIARAGRPVAGYTWHSYSDGQATFDAGDGGWILVTNSEALASDGAGSSAVRFAPDGTIEDAYRILRGTYANCAGGRTPWGTWLSCEEHDHGHVWECDPRRAGQGAIRPALGTFNHEAVAADTEHRRLYMTEDRPDGGLYRFTPDVWGDLTAGLLEVLTAGGWAVVPDPAAIAVPTRRQVAGTRRFDGGEGIWFDSGIVYFSTKGDDRVWAYDTRTGGLRTIYDRARTPEAPLRGVDNLTVSRAGEVFVCEDGDDLEICVIDPDGTVAPFLQLTGEAARGQRYRGNELAGVVFDPSGSRLYFSAQRAYGRGAVYEVSGPFAGSGPSGAPAAGRIPVPAGPPEVELELPARISLAGLRRRGLRVVVRSAAPARVEAALRTDDLARVPGKRGSVARPLTLRLARQRRALDAGGRAVLRLRIDAATAARLRRAGGVSAWVAVQVGHGAGARVAARRVRITR
jgi:hypothetical protein